MKTKFAVLIVLLGLLSCASETTTNNTKASTDNAASIVIKYVNPGITTIVPVSCEGFDASFKTEMRSVAIKEGTSDFKAMDSLLSLFTDDTSNKHIDVRVKILNSYRGDSVICMDELGHFFSKQRNRYMTNEPLKDFILKIAYSNH